MASLSTDGLAVLVRITSYRRAAIAAAAFGQCRLSCGEGSGSRSSYEEDSDEAGELHCN